MDTQFQEFEQEFRDEVPAPVQNEETASEQIENPSGENFNDSSTDEAERRKPFTFTFGFFVLCVASLLALIEIIKTIVYFFG